MPSIGRIKKLSVLGVATAALGVAATPASASDVWLWACHGPGGVAAGSAFDSSNFQDYGQACATTAADLDTGGLRGKLPVSEGGTATYGASTSASLRVPPNTQLTELRLQRRVTGAVAGVDYTASALGTTLPGESTSGSDVAADDKSFTIDPGSTNGGFVSLQLRCGPTTGCPGAGAAALDVGKVGMKVVEVPTDADKNRAEADKGKPTFAVGGTRTPAAGILDLEVLASDPGVGIKYVEAFIEGSAVSHIDYTTANCYELTPGDATVDLPYGNDCKHTINQPLKVNTTLLPDGTNYTLVVRVADWSGKVEEQRSSLEIANNVNLGTNTQTLNIGTSGTTTPGGNNGNGNGNGNGGSGNVAGGTAQNCSSPRLSFSLSQKPMRISNGVPVLEHGKRYRFNGRLTCVINGKRMSAPKRARIDIFNKIGSKTYQKGGTTVRDAGRITVILAYRSSRTITFRFTNSDGKRSQVSIKIKIEKKKAAR